MAFHYDPKDAATCLPKGDYDAQLASVEEKKSKSGLDMLLVVWTIPHAGKDHSVKDYILNSTLFKMRNIAVAWGMVQDFEERRFDLAEHINRQIVLRLEVRSDDTYGDKNEIKAYSSAAGSMPIPIRQPVPHVPPPSPDADTPGENIPF